MNRTNDQARAVANLTHSMGELRAVAFFVVAVLPSALRAQAPAQQCLLQYEAASPGANVRTNVQQVEGGHVNFFQGGGVKYRCEGQNNTLIADSAEYYGGQRVLYLIGDVHYTEPRTKVDSDRMTYYQVEDRLRAEGNVNVRSESGTTIRGPVIDYYRATSIRPLARTVATGRPRMAIVQRQPNGQPSDPVDVVANTLVSEGDNLIYASGSVDVTRPDILAKGDSVFFDGQRNFARLMLTPSVESRTGRKFTLTGGVIDLYSRDRRLERVVATPTGHVLSEDLELLADSVDLRVLDNQIQRVIAFGSKSRSRALSPDRQVIADSIDAIMPAQRLREVRAIGNAYVNSVADTGRIVSSERDWISGDTVIAEFDSIAPGDTTTRPQAKRIVAMVDARSFYQIAGAEPGRGLPNLNYVRGRLITITFVDRAVAKVDVTGQAAGVYLEPAEAGDNASPPADGRTGTSSPRGTGTAVPASALPVPAGPRRRIP